MMRSRWQSIEEELLNYYEGEQGDLSDESNDFLLSINFVNEYGTITDIGSCYLDTKFIFENDGHQAILRNEVLNLQKIRELCQSFYGQKTEREKIERFFKSKTDINDEIEVGRILGLLNHVDIVTYSKRNATVQFKETGQVEEQDQNTYRITHRTPYSNLVRFRKAIRTCAGDLLWVSRHFTKKGLEPLAEEVTGDKFDSVRILSGPANVDEHLRSDFDRFNEEMANRGIHTELRVITSTERLRSLHDRWLLSSDGASWNVPPINSLYGNQEAEIHKTEEAICFEEWWDESTEIINDWNTIQKYINN